MTTLSRVRSLALTVLLAPMFASAVMAFSFARANDDTRTIVVNGATRGYVLHVPTHLDRTRPVPLVLSFHGAGLWGAAQERLSQWNELADSVGFIVAYPTGAGGSGPRVWRVDRSSGMSRDADFVAALIDSVSREFRIDSTRVFADGLSNGGGMAFALSCLMPHRIAAVGLVASAQTLPFGWCPSREAVPVIAIHGTADPVTRYAGGSSWIRGEAFPAIPQFLARWAERNGCRSVPATTAVASDVARREYVGCSGNASVVLLAIAGGGHAWPGGGRLPEAWVGPTSRFNATRALWSFYDAHPLGNRRPPESGPRS